jgi:hypothetical protein
MARGKLYSVAAGVFVATLISYAAHEDDPDASAQRSLSAWKGKSPKASRAHSQAAHPGTARLRRRKSTASVRAKGRRSHDNHEQFLIDNPDMAEKSYCDVMPSVAKLNETGTN